MCSYHTRIVLAARGCFHSFRRTRHWLACAESSCEVTNPPENAVAPSERSRWEKKGNILMAVGASWPIAFSFWPSSSWVKMFNGGRASRVDGLILADLPNGHTTHNPHRAPAPAAPACTPRHFDPTPAVARALLLTCALHTRGSALSNPQNRFLCHTGAH